MSLVDSVRDSFVAPPLAAGFDALGSPWPLVAAYALAAAAGYAGFGLGDQVARARAAQAWGWRMLAALLLASGACSAIWLGMMMQPGLPLPPAVTAGVALLAGTACSMLALTLLAAERGGRRLRRGIAALALGGGLVLSQFLSLAAPGDSLLVSAPAYWLLALLAAVGGAALSLQLAAFARPRRAHAPPAQAFSAGLVFAASVLATQLAASAAVRPGLPPSGRLAGGVDWPELVLPLIGLALLLAALLVRLFDRRGVSSLLSYRARLRREQRVDAATGLPTAYVLGESFLRLQRLAVAGHASVAIAVVKLSGLERVLASHGSDERDQIYSLAAWRLRTVRRADDLLGVLGDERFVLVMRVDDAADATARVREVLALFDAPLRDEEVQIRVRPHAGISLWPAQGEHFERLLSNALVALERSRPGSVQVYLAAHREESERRGRIEDELAAALAGGELGAVFQPVLDAASGRVAAVEMLARWHSPTLGNVAPEHFVLIAETSGVIAEFDRWLLREALATVRWLDAAGLGHLRVAVNVSPLNLVDPGFADFVEALFAGSSLDPARLEVEITEAAIAAGDRSVMNTLIRLRTLGLSLAIDDFGIGHSSLARLRDLPVDRLKIDQSFVREIEHEDGEQMVAGIIGLAHGLGLAVTAEGVETETQRAILAELGCEFLQGYLISRPLSWRDLLDYLGEPAERSATGPFLSATAA
jgi:diguanylate cyclase